MPNNTGGRSSIELPTVTIITNAEKVHEQSYTKCVIKTYPGLDAPKAFNLGLDEIKEGYALCLSDKDEVYSDTVWRMVKPLSAMLNRGIYSDNFDFTNHGLQQYYPAWSIDVIRTGRIVNTPLLFLPDKTRYNEQLSVLYHYQFLIQYGMKHLLNHVATPLFVLHHNTSNIKDEIKVIEQCLR